VASFLLSSVYGKGARGQVNVSKGKKGEYHIYEQFRRSQKKIEYPPQGEKDLSPLASLESLLFFGAQGSH
jgi:hypothetical protein